MTFLQCTESSFLKYAGIANKVTTFFFVELMTHEIEKGDLAMFCFCGKMKNYLVESHPLFFMNLKKVTKSPATILVIQSSYVPKYFSMQNDIFFWHIRCLMNFVAARLHIVSQDLM